MGRAKQATRGSVGQGDVLTTLASAGGTFLCAAPALVTALVALLRAEQAHAAPSGTHRLTAAAVPVSTPVVTQPEDNLTLITAMARTFEKVDRADFTDFELDLLEQLSSVITTAVSLAKIRRTTAVT